MDKIEVKKIDNANAEVNGVITKKVLDEHIDKISASYAKNAKVEGFRVGKVPKKIIIQRYAKELKDDAVQAGLRDIVAQACKELKIKNTDLIGEPRVTKFDEKNKDELSSDIEVSIEMYIKPDFKIDGYKDLIPEVKFPKASKSEIEKQIKENAQNMGELVDDTTAKELKKDDYALFDFEGFVDGKAFEGGKAEGHSLQIGSGAFIPGFEDGMIGMKIGESRDVEVTFPKEYGEAKLAGKPAVFKVKLHKIQKKQEAKIDDELAKKLLPHEKDANLKMLEEKVAQQLNAQKQNKHIIDELKPKFVEALAKKYKFDIPKISIENEVNNLLAKKSQDMSEKEIETIKNDPAKLQKLKDECEGEAKKTAQIAYIIQAILEAENITVTDQEAEQTVYYEAMYTRQDPQQVLKHYKENGYMPMIKMNIAEQKLFAILFDDSKDKKADTKPKASTKTKKD